MDPAKLNKIIHERVRLAIMSALSARGELSFNELKRLLQVTDGNLSIHTSILEKHELIYIEKVFVGKKPRTTFRISNKGKELFKAYVGELEKMIQGFSGSE